jgi:hypothetical protein
MVAGKRPQLLHDKKEVTLKTRLRLALPLLLTITVLLTTSSRLPADTGTCGGGMVTLPFTDVAGNAFFCQIAQAFFSGLTNGTTLTTYSPKDNVTRDQMAAFITRTQDSAVKRRRLALEQWPIKSGGYLYDRTYSTTSGQNQIKSDGTDFWITHAAGVSSYSASTGLLVADYPMANAFGLMIYRPGIVCVTLRTSPGSIELINLHRALAATMISKVGNQPIGITTDGTYLWTANYGGSVSRVTFTGDASTFTAGFAAPVGALFDGTSVWVTDFAANDLKKLDSNGNILQSVPCGTGPQLPAYDGANIWVPSYYSNSVTVVRAKDGLVLASLTGNGLSGAVQAAFDGERILVTNSLGHNVSLWKAADLTEIGSSFLYNLLGQAVTPYGVCSDGIGFLITLTDFSLVVPF